MTTPGDNLQISSTKRAFFLTAQAQVTASGYFPDLIDQKSTLSADRHSCQRNSFSAECRCRLHAVVSVTLCAVWRKQTSARSSHPIKNRTTPAWQLDHVNPAYSLKRHIMKIIMIIKIMITVIKNKDLVTIIMITLRRFIHFYLRKILGTRIPWKELGLLLFKYCLKNGSNFPMNMSVKHVS